MAKLPRIVIPKFPHHVTQRGNRRQQTFFDTKDYQTYLNGLATACERYEVKISAYCLMPNHVHLTAIPPSKEALSKAIGQAHEFYTRYINYKKEWQGYLWQGRFRSFVMDGAHFLKATRYIELNPVKAGLVKRAEEWPWSSARFHLFGREDPLIRKDLITPRVESWQAFLEAGMTEEELESIKDCERSGRPYAEVSQMETWEKSLGLRLIRRKPGPKRKERS